MVIVQNTRGPGQATEQIRIQEDIGTIAELRIGGYRGGTPPEGGNWITQVQVRNDVGNVAIGLLRLGETDTDRDRAVSVSS